MAKNRRQKGASPRANSKWRERFLAGRRSTRKIGVYFPDRDLLWTRSLQERAEEDGDTDSLRAWERAWEREEEPVVLVSPGEAAHMDRSIAMKAGRMDISRYRSLTLIDVCREPQTDADGEFVLVDGAYVPALPMFDVRDLEALEDDAQEINGPLSQLIDACMAYLGTLAPERVVDSEEDVEPESDEEVLGNSTAGS